MKSFLKTVVKFILFFAAYLTVWLGGTCLLSYISGSVAFIWFIIFLLFPAQMSAEEARIRRKH